LEAIFTVSINLDNLKGIIEFILQRLQGHDSHLKKSDVLINEMDVKLVTKLMQVDKNKENIQLNKDEIERLKKMTKELEEKTNELDSNLSNHKAESD